MCSNKTNTKPRAIRHHDSGHDHDHLAWSRRSFMQVLGLAGAGSMFLGGSHLSAAAPNAINAALASTDNDRILVLIRLKGGNDGLNTIVPLYDYDLYAQKRPTIRHQQQSLYNLSSNFGLPDSLKALQELWGEGAMKVAHGVGYPDQNLSHFRSADIWASGNNQQELDTGVLGRYFQDLYPDYLMDPPAEPTAIQIGSIGNLLFEGTDTNYAFTLNNPDQLATVAENGKLHDLANLPSCTYGSQLGFLRSTTNNTLAYAEVINAAYENGSNTIEYGTDQLSRQLSILAKIIKGGLRTQMYLVTLDGFDTHANQVEIHNRLMQNLAEGVSNFYKDLEAGGHHDRVLSMTFSEFGRRIEENGSNGTDHGAASPVLIFGSGLEGNGFIGNHPDLSAPDDIGNLQYSTDFRSLYATVLKDWLCIDAPVVDALLPNGPYESKDLGFSCTSLSNPAFANTTTFMHYASFQGDQTFINYENNTHGRVKVELYSMLGQKIETLLDEVQTAGNKQINIKQNAETTLFAGPYIYVITISGNRYSKKLILK